MHIVRYAERDTGAVHVGALQDQQVAPLENVHSFAELLGLSLEQARKLTEGAANANGRPVDEVLLLPPVDGLTEVWASGVTYGRSMDARVEESASQDIYTRVYGADRPELFFKCPSWRVVTEGEPVAVRPDSEITVPEPELALIVNSVGEVLGYTVCNDMSSRDIEGENPLYIPQAKTYAGSCAIAVGVRPVWEVVNATALSIRLSVCRDGVVVFAGETSTARLHRSLRDLVDHLFRAIDFPAGVVLSTGTGIVPEIDFTLRLGDRVNIDIDEVGSLSNPVRSIKEAVRWAATAIDNPLTRLEIR